MKDLTIMIIQIVVLACVLGFAFSLLNYFLGWELGFKGAVVPADLRATASFLVAAVVFAAIGHFWSRSGKG